MTDEAASGEGASTPVDPQGSEKDDGAFRTISEVAEELDVAQHVLRFWESKFPQVRPLKRGGGRRYYRPEDTEILRQIRVLLYDQGYTIRGAQRLLRGRRTRPGGAADLPEPEPVASEPVVREAPPPRVPRGLEPASRKRLHAILDDLVGCRDRLARALK